MSDPTSQVIAVCRDHGGDRLRDVWIFDADRHTSLFVRDDVASTIDEIDVVRYVDAERYGYVTRDTYGELHHAEYRHTVRGFDEYDQYRTFLEEGSDRIGLLASFDCGSGPCDYQALTSALIDAVDPGSLAATLDAAADE